MDPASLVPPLVSVLTTALISAVKDPIGRAFENRTKRVQFWKTMLDAAPLAEVKDVEFFKEQCRNEMTEAVDSVAAMSNKFAGRMSILLLLAIGLFVLSAFAHVGMVTLNRMRAAGRTEAAVNHYALVSVVIQAATISVGWFWGRWKLRRWVLSKIRPGINGGVKGNRLATKNGRKSRRTGNQSSPQ